jgi:hypothetical protein
MLTMPAVFIWFVVSAVKGRAYRGAYFATGLIAAVFGFLAMSLADTVVPNDAPLAQRRGAEVLSEWGPPIAGWLFVAAFGAVVAGIAYRPSKTSRPVDQGQPT